MLEHPSQIYVNREAKIDYYGKDFPEIDPVPRIAELVSKATNLTDMEFHEAMSTLFLTLRDKHTNYYIPGPYACYFAVMPIFFDFINSVDLERLPSLAIKRFARFSKILELSGDDLEKVSIGDILLRVNGESFRSYYQKNKWMANGANEYGGMRSVADHMSSRAGLLNMMPVEDHMVFELFSITKLRSYTVKFPVSELLYEITHTDLCYTIVDCCAR